MASDAKTTIRKLDEEDPGASDPGTKTAGFDVDAEPVTKAEGDSEEDDQGAGDPGTKTAGFDVINGE